ncbi:hypothetical protein Tco_0964988 [Tanacetum coccineum]
MSSASSAVTYTSVYTDSEPGRPCHLRTMCHDLSIYHLPITCPVLSTHLHLSRYHTYLLEYPEYLAPFDVEAPLEDQPLPIDASPTALSPGYVADSDTKEDSEEDPEEDHADYPADKGDDDNEPSNDDDDYTDDGDEEPFEDEDDDEDEEEHLALADSSAVPVVDPVPSARDTEAFETDKSAPTPRSPQIRIPFAQTRLRRARKTVKLKPPMSPSMEARIAEYIPSPPLPPLPSSLHLPPPVPTSLPLPSSPLPPLPVSLFIPPPVDRREDIPEAELPPRKRLCSTAPTSRYEVGESLTAAPRPTGGHRADYGFIGTTDAEIRRQRAEEVGYGIRDVWVDPIEAVEEDGQDRQTQLFQRVDGLVEDGQFHYETARLLDQEAHDSYPDAGLPYRLTGVTDDDIDCTCFITTGTVVSGIRIDLGTSG